MRRSYPLRIKVNGRDFNEVVIDDHYELKHSESMNDFIILRLMQALDGEEVDVDSRDVNGFEYIVAHPVWLSDRAYKLVCAIPPEPEIYIGVLNAFRINFMGERK